ncbi:Thiosulfate sulfurtransferase PspE [Pontiella desulfatans]|uniref:Thiosulfate sulfurtransferase PspE n=1 Tax=Pontiella desulfatans TaxID=2750659 RepID=A0A6C2U4J4_PONDE|nr:rhodanese-like domain-containing protein [Pontiella desulfatans]VGO14461.1 Thiosulfate sulfurtransferase PspE [Pontiella desulfatans]
MGFLSNFFKSFAAPDVDLKKLMDEGARVLDVRSPAEYANGHIEGSINIPHTNIKESVGKVVPAKDALIIVYCHSGARAAVARGVLEKMGYTRVTNGRTYHHMLHQLSH